MQYVVVCASHFQLEVRSRKDGREFRGMWKGAVIHGCGKYSWPDGQTFCGQCASSVY